MFHIVRNTLIRETELLANLVAAIRARLPGSWDVAVRPSEAPPSLIDTGVDAILRIAGPDGRGSDVLITAKTSPLTPKEALGLARWAPAPRPGGVLLAAPYLSPRARELLAGQGFGYFDETGNLRVSLERPALFIETVGADKDPFAKPRTLGSLKGPAAGRVVRALVDFTPPYGIRELGERAGISAPTVSRVVDLLDDEAVLQREERGGVTKADPTSVVRRWVQDYAMATSNRGESYLAPRGIPWLRERLTQIEQRYAVTASLAVPDELRVAPAKLAVVYVGSFTDAVDALDLRRVDAGMNVLLLESRGGVAMERTRTVDGLRCVALSQAAADLLTSPGRGPTEGEELLEWMQGNQDAWRA